MLGATDPSSGTVSVNEVVRGFGALLKLGWKPLRTLVFASWDAEEVKFTVLARSIKTHATLPYIVRTHRQHRMGRRLR